MSPCERNFVLWQSIYDLVQSGARPIEWVNEKLDAVFHGHDLSTDPWVRFTELRLTCAIAASGAPDTNNQNDALQQIIDARRPSIEGLNDRRAFDLICRISREYPRRGWDVAWFVAQFTRVTELTLSPPRLDLASLCHRAIFWRDLQESIIIFDPERNSDDRPSPRRLDGVVRPQHTRASPTPGVYDLPSLVNGKNPHVLLGDDLITTFSDRVQEAIQGNMHDFLARLIAEVALSCIEYGMWALMTRARTLASLEALVSLLTSGNFPVGVTREQRLIVFCASGATEDQPDLYERE